MKDYRVTMHYMRSLGWPAAVAHKIILAYGIVAGIQRKDYPGMEYYYKMTEFIQNDFGTFLKFYGAVKCHYQSKRIQTRRVTNWQVPILEEVEEWA